MRGHDEPKQQPYPYPHPRCTCGNALLIYIAPGQHLHLCPVHPDNATYGDMVVYR